MTHPIPASDDEAGRRDPMHAFAELALISVDSAPAEQTLRQVTELAKQTLPGVEEVSLTLIEHGQPRSPVFTGQLAVDLDERQYELGFGPCMDAAKTGQTILVDDNTDGPYRDFARVASRAGVRNTLSVGMPIAGRSIGGLNIYLTAGDPISPAFLEYAEVFAGYAAVAVNNVASYARTAAEVTQLRTAMESRAAIEQAKGIVIARDHCTPDEAFDILRRISQNSNAKLHDIARAVVDATQK